MSTAPRINFEILRSSKENRLRLLVSCMDTSFGPHLKNGLASILGVEAVHPKGFFDIHVIVVDLASDKQPRDAATTIAETIAEHACWSDYDHNIEHL